MKRFTYVFCFVVVSLVSLTSCSKDSLGEDLETAELKTGFPPVSYSSFELEVLDLVNGYRIENGLSELDILDESSRQAENHNLHMLEEGEVCHDGFPNRYSALVDAVSAKAVSENVAFGYRSSEAVVNAWIKSEGHRENMLGNHTHFGISISQDAEGKFYFTNIFVRK